MPPVDGITGTLSQLTRSNERLLVADNAGSTGPSGDEQDITLRVEAGKKGPRLGSHFVKTADHKARNRATASAFIQQVTKAFDSNVSADVEKALAKSVSKGRSLTGRRIQHLVKPSLLDSVLRQAVNTKLVASLSRSSNNGELDSATRDALKHEVDNIDKALSAAPNKKTQRALLIIKADINRELGSASLDPRTVYKPTKGLLKSRRGILIAADPAVTRATKRLAVKPDVAKAIASHTPGSAVTDAQKKAAFTILQATEKLLGWDGLSEERTVELASQILRGDFSGVLAREAEVWEQGQSALGENVERAGALGNALQRRGSVVLDTTESVQDVSEPESKAATEHDKKALRIAQFVSSLQQTQPLTSASIKQAFLDNPEGLVELIVSKPDSAKTKDNVAETPTKLPALWRDAGISRELGVALVKTLDAVNLSKSALGYYDISLIGRQSVINEKLGELDAEGEEQAFGALTAQLSSEQLREQNDAFRGLAAALVSVNATAQNPDDRRAQLSEVLQQNRGVLERIKADPDALESAGFGKSGLTTSLAHAANLIATHDGAYSAADLDQLSGQLEHAVDGFDFNKTGGLDLLKTVSDDIEGQGHFTKYLADVFDKYGESLSGLDKALLLSAHLSGSNPADGELGALKGTIKGAGPYLQKILQNLGDLIKDERTPLAGASPSVTRAAVKDVIASVKHELAPIDPKIRNSLLANLALTSEAQVTALPELAEDANTNTLQRHTILRNIDRIGDYLVAAENADASAKTAAVDAIARDLLAAGVSGGLSHDALKEKVSLALTNERDRANEAGVDLHDTTHLRDAVASVATSLYSEDARLSSVDWQAVQAQNANVISGIAFKSSLGAASVGETYLVDLSYKKSAEPTRAVIKLLRPGIAERAIREREVLSGIALLENPDGSLKHPGQKQTFAGIANQIDTELSLTREYDNVVAGQKYYANQHPGVEPVKLVAGVPRNRDALALELAPGKTLTDRLNQVRAYRFDTGVPFDHPDDFDPLTDTPKLGDQLRNALSTWLFASLIDNGQRGDATGEGASGFYHGDLHGGNILYKGPSDVDAPNDRGTLTLIDFGNAAHFPHDQRKQLVYLLSAPDDPTISDKGAAAAKAFDELLSNETLANIWNKPVGGEHGNKTARQAFIAEVNRKVANEKDGAGLDPFRFLQLALDTANTLNVERPAIVSNFARSLTLISQQLDEFEGAHAQALHNHSRGVKGTGGYVRNWGNSVNDRIDRLPKELADPESLSSKRLHTKNDWKFLNELNELANDPLFRAELQALHAGTATSSAKGAKVRSLDVGALSEHLLQNNGVLTPELFKAHPQLLDQFVVAYLHHATKVIEAARVEVYDKVRQDNPELDQNELRTDNSLEELTTEALRNIFSTTLTPGIIELAHDHVIGAQYARDGYQDFGKQYNLRDRGFVAIQPGTLRQLQEESATHFDFSGTLDAFFAAHRFDLLSIIFGVSTGKAPDAR